MAEPFSKKTLEKMWKGVESPDEKLHILFLISLDTACRIKKLETRKRFDTVISGIGGIVGGVMAYIGTFVLKRPGV